MSEECKCKLCETHDLLRWATIMECPCYCHTNNKVTGHDSLCCSYPNGLKKDNPYKELKPAKYYRILLNQLESE